MISHFLSKFKNFVVTLRFSIMTVFCVLFAISMLSLLSITYYRFSAILSYAAERLMEEVSLKVYEEITNEIRNVKVETHYLAKLVESGAIDQKNLAEFVPVTYNLVTLKSEALPSIRSAAWADETGNFVQSEKNLDGSSTSNIINRYVQPVTSTLIKRDINHEVTRELYRQKVTFDPRERFWYIEAKKKKDTYFSAIYQYVYMGVKYWGITVATPAFKENGEFIGVFAIQIGMNYIRNIIEKIKFTENGKIFITTETGGVIAFPHLSEFNEKELVDVHRISLPWIGKSFDLYQKNKRNQFSFSYEGKKYISAYNSVVLCSTHRVLIGMVLPENDFIGQLIKINYLVLLVGFIILIFSILIVSWLITRIVKPLKMLAQETESIKNFDLKNDIHIASRIQEISLLATALASMKKGLRAFQKYVPANLVRQLIEAGEDAHIGGAKKQVVVLFSDVKDFTSIVEYEDPEKLTTHLCEYFDVLSHEIVEARGTIDKYIGDSIMAFWGAPLFEPEPAEQAAKAALQCAKKNDELNVRWQEQGIPAFVTRFGIHMGHALIGNVGSSERLNYTAIGNAINTASRLEGVNKIYGTKILVSEVVYAILKNKFVLRMVDCVTLKGKAEKTFIYELLAENRSEIHFDIEKYNESFAAGFAAYQQRRWDEATGFFKQCVVIYPYDTVAKLVVERCENLKLHPPESQWDGVFRLVGK